MTVEQLGQFDNVIMNPPFHLRSDIRHIQHARKFLKPGGKLAAICMNTRQRREEFMIQSLKWEALPSGSFLGGGTNVDAAIVILEA